MKNVPTYVGIEAHRKDLFVATLVGTEKTPVTWQLANEAKAVHRLVRKLERDAPGPIRVFYEAGPCGYALQRQLTTPRVRCEVIAPALMPRKPGERVKTNRRDGCKLVELGRGGVLKAGPPPAPGEGAGWRIAAGGAARGGGGRVIGVDPRVSGTQRYSVHVERPGMLHAAFVRSPHAHARVLAVDASGLPGDCVALLPEDVADLAAAARERFPPASCSARWIASWGRSSVPRLACVTLFPR